MVPALPRILAFAPAGLGEPGPVVAAGRAGSLGVLDFAYDFRASAAVSAARRVARFGDHPFGLRLPAENLSVALLRDLPTPLRVLILTEPEDGGWERALAEARDLGLTGLAEVTTRRSAQEAATAGAGGLVVAGHESGGRGSDESSLILLQAVLSKVGDDVPVWVRGGIGPLAAAACVAAGATGVVLDGALLLARESPLPPAVREAVARVDGSETLLLGPSHRPLRLFASPRSPVIARLNAACEGGSDAWDAAVRSEVGWGPGQAWPVGQDAAHASELATRWATVGGIVQAVERAIHEGIRRASEVRPLSGGGPLAASHGTKYPIAQGPMTRVSDTPAFSAAVADAGGLPFLALALMGGPACRPLLAQTAAKLAGRPWGVGILGFVPPDLRREQVEAIREVRPPFALIAGGRPDQAKALEKEGIATYLHTPSPGLLRQFLKDGARRFVLEGRECGGHVGPRSSLLLWEQGVGVVEEAIGGGVPPQEVHLLFAGGIHDGRSAAAVSALAAPLAARGVKVGVLMGTAYLFTEEAVATGAVVPGFQAEALRCERTTLLTSGPGHEIRVSPTPFAARFEAERRRLLAEGKSHEEVREALERLNSGRLRIAAKGIDRSEGAGSTLVEVHPYDQHERGAYMLGQVATLRQRVTTIAELHREVARGSTARLERLSARGAVEADEPGPSPSDVAIIGMAAFLPGAESVRAFWRNTLRGVDTITEIPPDRWDWRLYYDPDPKAPDKITSKWGGFLPEIPFDPLRYGMPPASVPSIEPMQLLMLEAVRSALDDAGYRDRAFPRERTAVVLGAGGGAAQLAMGYAVRSYLPLIEAASGPDGEGTGDCLSALPEWTEDSFPGILLNVAAGRVANRFDLGGANYTVDAACGSSLAAAALAVRELETGAADMVILGGADTVQNPFTYLAFSKTHAFSPRGRCRPFDASADGIVISEGVAVVVLKRLADAERDGDRIYAVIKGIGASSDGRDKGLTAPRPEGQVRALRRAYAKAGVSPATVGYVEAHGTGTAAGDLSEVSALNDVFREAGAARGSCGLGSVKSSIGHTKCAAGLAGLINASLALHHKVLPPTIGIETPNPRADLASSPFHLSTAPRPWLHAAGSGPRRAGVSAFGFGGTNFHLVLEEYDRDPLPTGAAIDDWPAELIALRATSSEALTAEVDRLLAALARPKPPTLKELAACLNEGPGHGDGPHRLAIVADSHADLAQKLERAQRAIRGGTTALDDPTGVYYDVRVDEGTPRVAFLFPGQGSQAPDMLGELAMAFEEVREGFEAFDEVLHARGLGPVGPRIFSPPALDEPGQEARREALRPTEVAQPALGAACTAMLRLLAALGVEPDALAGHSFGELVALHAAGALSLEGLAALAEARGRLMNEAASGIGAGGMAALAVGPDGIGGVLDGIDRVLPVNWNGPAQTVVSGPNEGVCRAVERARSLGIRAQMLAVGGAFHSPSVAAASAPLAALAAGLIACSPRRPVYSNAHAALYPADPRLVAEEVGRHVASPVRFAELIEAMHADGVRIFFEVGPGSTLAPLVDSILGERPHLAVSCERPGRTGVVGLLHTLGRLHAAGIALKLGRLAAGRRVRKLDPGSLAPIDDESAPNPSMWLVNGARSRPAFGPEPTLLGASGAGEIRARPRRRPGPEPCLLDRGAGSRGMAEQNPNRRDGASVVPPRPHAPDPGTTRVVAAFQDTMRGFLQAQREAMIDYLSRGATAAPAGTPPGAISPARSPHAESISLSPSTAEPKREPVARTADSRRASDGPAVVSQTPDPAGVLIRIVRDRTGYPPEMLKPDLDLEADLGIDSIKRVEILGTLRDSLTEIDPGSIAAAMDELSRARTLGAILKQLEGLARRREGGSHTDSKPAVRREPRADPGAQTPGPGVTRAASIADQAGVRRFVLEAVETPLSGRRAGLAPGGLILLTDDGRGIARAVAADLRALGHPVQRIRHGGDEGEDSGVDLTSESDVSGLMNRLRERGPIAGIVHLLPLRSSPPTGLDASMWAERIGSELRGLFLLARAATEDLARAAARGGGCLLAATGLGGAFASAGLVPGDFFPGHGGIAGLVKTIAREWTAVRTRAVDLDPEGVVEVLAADLVRELFADDTSIEVGYRDGRRVGLRHVPREFAGEESGGIELSPGDPVVLTGGARGITASVAWDLASRWRPTLLLLGSGPLPPEVEDADTAGLTSPAELKAALLDRLRRDRYDAGPAEVERAYHALRRDREIRENLGLLRSTGATIRYATSDVRDEAQLRRALDDWRREYGPPVGLLHGAGVIQDKLLRDKSPESFDRVLGTKLDGALNLARAVDPERLRFAVFFSSVAGRFGNRGQSDYAAANEILDKLAIWLDGRWPGRVVSMIWGPWSRVGMVSDLEAHLGRQGLGLIPPEVGRAWPGDELQRGSKGDVEVIISGDLGHLEHSPRSEEGRR